MPKSQTISKPTEPEQPAEAISATEQFAPIPNHPLAPYMGMFRDSAFFDDVVENMRIREEEEKKQYMEEEGLMAGESILA